MKACVHCGGTHPKYKEKPLKTINLTNLIGNSDAVEYQATWDGHVIRMYYDPGDEGILEKSRRVACRETTKC